MKKIWIKTKEIAIYQIAMKQEEIDKMIEKQVLYLGLGHKVEIKWGFGIWIQNPLHWVDDEFFIINYTAWIKCNREAEGKEKIVTGERKLQKWMR